MQRQSALPAGGSAMYSERIGQRIRSGLRATAAGRDPGPVGGILSRRALPRWRRHRKYGYTMSESKLSSLEQQTVALAGVAQAARLVDQLSRTGSYPIEFL